MKTILITGSSRGIGKAIALLAHKQDYRIIVHGRTDSKELKQTHQQLTNSLKAVFDVTDKKATREAIEDLLNKVGSVDVLVNNAGVALNFISDIAQVDDEKAIEEYKTDVLGAIHCLQAILPSMLERKRGSVINIGSIKGYPNLSTLSTLTYAPAKAGLIAITKALAKVYPQIRLNVVSPSYVETEQVKKWNSETFDRINNGTILGRIAKPEEIAPLVMFLASDDASYITGSDFLVDGGYSIKGK